MSVFRDADFVSPEYALYRPHYPEALYQKIFEFWGRKSFKGNNSVALDVATGTGQAAQALAQYFDLVIATDVSEVQLKSAVKLDNIQYRLSSAEDLSSVSSNSVDLVTVAEGAHWFNLPLFFAEVDRVLKPDGVLAIWGYNTAIMNTNAATKLNLKWADEILGPYWEKGRDCVAQNYVDVVPPFARTERFIVPSMRKLTVKDYVRYLETWSCYKTYRQRNPALPDPLIDFTEELLDSLQLQDLNQETDVRWDLFLILSSRK
mmetsp:Transcript_23024/g.37874  ORF Transcript_23024/g.37874 Transcript_23024/m.37874 type:complete len:261 (+) Transcript_23024:158-940(+)|eukprot:CAMPEP_0184644110 /NCGR_PEP_ID=MMETSP0308-20130426/873_1 /TAXON_ID=38269 /ORGANISM="Gloeochaete witrockiana, Strain SAG 46.84" /LENGTH=260 /DNA_ID=CAMNT_0027072443 /DNA_START=129 /DNA_END=911 /DNA_ORIENTATION=+